MGTTLTAAVVRPDGLDLVHVGDSRAYLLRGGALRLLTEDHTLVDRMIRAGEISAEEAEVHPHRNVLLRVARDRARRARRRAARGAAGRGPRAAVLGRAHDMIAEEQILAIASATPDPQETADRLVTAANRAGGIDNITVIVLDVRREEGDPPPVEAPPAQGRSVRKAIVIAVDRGDRGRRRRSPRRARGSTRGGTWASPADTWRSTRASRSTVLGFRLVAPRPGDPGRRHRGRGRPLGLLRTRSATASTSRAARPRSSVDRADRGRHRGGARAGGGGRDR